jgi:hypothetical protein
MNTFQRVALFPMVLLALNAMHECQASEHKKYTPKTFIDTLVQQAFINLNATTDNMPGSELRRRQAVIEAKNTVAKLRVAAKGDPNEKYILWKTGELESQILLEERDFILKQLEMRQKEKNAIIEIFNAELGKKRPEFAVLKKAIDNMKSIDPVKTEEMQRSFDQRSFNISRETVSILENALLEGNTEKMQRELNYCEKNRAYLAIVQSAFNRLETRILAQGEAIKQKPVIDEQLARVEYLLPQNMFGEVWTSIADIEDRFYRIESDLPPKTREAYSLSIKKCIEATNHREDSLAAIPYSICAKNGENAALDYIEHVLKPMKISETKLGQATLSILRIAASRKKADDTVLGAEMRAISQQQTTGVDFSMVRSAAKKKAQDRADSVRAIEEEKSRRLNREEARADSTRQVQQLQEQRALRAKQEKADDTAAQIYAILESNKIDEAYKKFISLQKPLEQYMKKDAFLLLKSTVLQTYLTVSQEHIGSPGITSEDLGEKSSSDKNNGAGEQTAESLQSNQEKAQQVVAQIYSLLETNDVDAAYKRFCEVRTPLEKYLYPEAYRMVETMVLHAYCSEDRQKKANR